MREVQRDIEAKRSGERELIFRVLLNQFFRELNFRSRKHFLRYCLELLRRIMEIKMSKAS